MRDRTLLHAFLGNIPFIYSFQVQQQFLTREKTVENLRSAKLAEIQEKQRLQEERRKRARERVNLILFFFLSLCMITKRCLMIHYSSAELCF